MICKCSNHSYHLQPPISPSLQIPHRHAVYEACTRYFSPLDAPHPRRRLATVQLSSVVPNGLAFRSVVLGPASYADATASQMKHIRGPLLAYMDQMGCCGCQKLTMLRDRFGSKESRYPQITLSPTQGYAAHVRLKLLNQLLYAACMPVPTTLVQ